MTSQDEYNFVQAHQLVLGVLPSPDVTTPRSGAEPSVLVADLIASDAFRVVASGALSGEHGSRDLPLVSTLHWVRTRFGLEISAFESRLQLLGMVMQSRSVADLLARPEVPLAFAPDSLVAILRNPLPPLPRPTSITLEERLTRDSRGLEIVRIQDMEITGERGVRFTSSDPALIMNLQPDTFGDAPAVELTFVVGGARKRTQGSLYIAYEEGFSEDRRITLTPKGRREYRALLLDPSAISNVRWDPDDREGEVLIAYIAARPVEFKELEVLIHDVLPTFMGALTASPHRRSSLVFDLTAELTQKLYNHGHLAKGEYDEWIEENEPAPYEAAIVWKRELDALEIRPLISILVPTYETPAMLLREMIESVLAQVYQNWELCIADDASRSPHVRDLIESYMAHDGRIKAVFRKKNGHISEASNSALGLAEGEWLALLDHDDLLTPNALLSIATEAATHPGAEFIYSDEDKLDLLGARYEPFFKPEYSAELLRSQNYLNHLSVHRTENVRSVGGWRKGYEGSQDYDLNLRILEGLDPEKVRHVPKVLYHWRAVEGSTAKSSGEKSYAYIAGLKALEDHVERMGWAADVEEVKGLPFYRVRYQIPDPAPLVSLIIPTRDHAELLKTCVQSILDRTEYSNYEILIVDNGSVEAKTLALFDALAVDNRIRIIHQPGLFNYSRINNAAAALSRGEIIGLVNNDIEVISSGWMGEMVSWASQPRIGCVGAKLYYPNDTIQHAGVVLGLLGLAGHAFRNEGRENPCYFGHAAVSHDVSAVTGACLFVRSEVFNQVGGLDERLQVAFNDIDFCIRVREAGFKNVFTPFAELYHHESVSRGLDDLPEKRARFLSEVDFMRDRWGVLLESDPFYSPNLTQDREDFSLRA